MKNSDYDTKDVKKKCEVKLDIEFKKKGPHYNGWYSLNGKKAARITVSKGKKFIPKGTYSSMARQLKLSVNQFDALLECPLTKERYDTILKETD
jgi:predicted RNA binding protein YcfA (HicA-like mRNA interferase family)